LRARRGCRRAALALSSDPRPSKPRVAGRVLAGRANASGVPHVRRFSGTRRLACRSSPAGTSPAAFQRDYTIECSVSVLMSSGRDEGRDLA